MNDEKKKKKELKIIGHDKNGRIHTRDGKPVYDEFTVLVWKRDGTGFDEKLVYICPSTSPSEWASFGSY